MASSYFVSGVVSSDADKSKVELVMTVGSTVCLRYRAIGCARRSNRLTDTRPALRQATPAVARVAGTRRKDPRWLDMTKRKMVLVVEDEPFVRMSAADSLADAGFETAEAADAEEAMWLLKRGPTIDVLFTDVDMPGRLNGLGLAAQVANERPEIVQVVTSGSRRIPDVELPDGGVFLQKPYKASELIFTVNKQLDGGD